MYSKSGGYPPIVVEKTRLGDWEGDTYGGDIDAPKSDKNNACELGWMRGQESLDKISQLKDLSYQK